MIFVNLLSRRYTNKSEYSFKSDIWSFCTKFLLENICMGTTSTSKFEAKAKIRFGYQISIR